MQGETVVGIITKIDLIEYLAKKSSDAEPASVRPKSSRKKTGKRLNGARSERRA
ncbi:hypothetical protein D3C83_280390 [compost metagenome]